jgi:predicted ATPase
MFITRLILKNWRNFREADISLREFTYILGANASGKSNLLDVFRFLKDVSKPSGGGLQKALADRGGISKLRCLHARQQPYVRIEVHMSSDFDDIEPEWKYILAFKPEGSGLHRTLITKEIVYHKGKMIIDRPLEEDKSDDVRLTQTHLEQIQANTEFRDIATFFSDTNYLHIVPQMLKYADIIGGSHLEDDPFGQDFLKGLAKTPEKTRNSRLKKIQTALSLAVPQFLELKYEQDEMGHPHLYALYQHHRPKGGWQKEDQFSDGTLRLIGILWSLMTSSSLLLLEEPEISLNDAIVEQIPIILSKVRPSKKKRQVIITTHSEKLLGNKGIDAKGVIILEQSSDGSKARQLNDSEKNAVMSGFSVAEIALPKTKPTNVEQLSLWSQ